MSDDTFSTVKCDGCSAEHTRQLKCRECGSDICESCADDEVLCVDCAPDPEDELVTCDGCGEEGYAERDNMFTFNCKVCGSEICENCSSNNLCETCEAKTTGVRTFHFP